MTAIIEKMNETMKFIPVLARNAEIYPCPTNLLRISRILIKIYENAPNEFTIFPNVWVAKDNINFRIRTITSRNPPNDPVMEDKDEVRFPNKLIKESSITLKIL